MLLRMNKVVLVFVVIFSICSIYAQGSKFVAQQVIDADKLSHPNSQELSFQAYIANRPQYTLDEDSPGSFFGLDEEQRRFLIGIDVANFVNLAGSPEDWSPYEIVLIEISWNKKDILYVVDFMLEPGNDPIVKDADNGLALVLGSYVNEILFISKYHLISTSAELSDGYPDDGVYRAREWDGDGKYWQIQFSTTGFLEPVLRARIRKQHDQAIDRDNGGGPRYFITQYSLDGEEWIAYGNPEQEGDLDYWILPDYELWLDMNFILPEECDNREKVYVRWKHANELGDVDNDAWCELCAVVTSYDVIDTSADKAAAPVITTHLHQNYPNPFNPHTTIAYTLVEETKVTLKIYDITGREIRVIDEGVKEKGRHYVTWEGTNSEGTPVSSGVYFYRLSTKKQQLTRKMMLIK